MNPDLQKALADFLSTLTTSAQTAIGVVGEQIPPILKERILLGRIEESIEIIFALCCLIAIWPLIKLTQTYWVKADEAVYDQDDIFVFMGGICGGGAAVCFLLSMVFIFGRFHNFVAVWFAPRLYVVEWLLSLKK